MAEYINREDLLNNLKQFAPEYLKPLIVSLIEKQPTADVAEVVRCKDCFFYQKDKELAKANYLDPEKYCALLICEIDKNGFCSYGKKNGR